MKQKCIQCHDLKERGMVCLAQGIWVFYCRDCLELILALYTIENFSPERLQDYHQKQIKTIEQFIKEVEL